MTDIIELVLQDHHAVAALFDKLQAATSADDQTALFEQSKDAIEEHDQIRGSLKEVEEHEAGTELFTLAVTQLVATTKHHVGVEESELLPDFRKNSEASERE